MFPWAYVDLPARLLKINRLSLSHLDLSQSKFKVAKPVYTVVGGSRAGGCRANFAILQKIYSEALGPISIFEENYPQL